MPQTLSIMLLTVLVSLLPLAAQAADSSRAEMRSLDDQVQEIKSDVLGIAAELEVLEERLLFPSNTQVSVFVALGEGEKFRLDSVQLGINDELATHHIYSFKELEALQHGGVQRLYMGNLPTGTHNLEISVTGKLPSGKDYSRSERFTFEKGVEPSLLSLTLAPDSGGSPIALKDW